MARKRVDSCREFVRRNANATIEFVRVIVVAADVEQGGTAGEERPRALGVEPDGRPPA
jgi:hypothetical protein